MTDTELLVLARLYLDNENSFVVRRCVQRFEAREMTARQAVEFIRRHSSVTDDDSFPDASSAT